MRTKRQQKVQSNHVRVQPPLPEETNEFFGLPESYLDREQQLIHDAQGACPCCEFRLDEIEGNRHFQKYHEEVTAHLASQSLQEALWSGNIVRLQELAPCGCCCAEHTKVSCPTRQWNGCKGDISMNNESLAASENTP